jgi:hypothetical protein
VHKKIGEMTMPSYTASSMVSHASQAPEWSPKMRRDLVLGLQDPAKKAIVKKLRNKYRDLDSGFILDTVFRSNWDPKEAEESIKKLHGSLRCSSPAL